MKIYGQTDDLIVRKMTKADLEKFLEFIEERGNKDNLTLEEVEMLWRTRNKKSDLQCTVTDADGKEIYGFCGIRHIAPKTKTLMIDFFEKYENTDYKAQVKKIMIRMGLTNALGELNIQN